MTRLKQQVVRFAPPQLVHWGRCLFDKDYRRTSHHLKQLSSVPRYQPAVTAIFGQPFEVADSASFISTFQQLFKEQIYRFEAKTAEPLIIDCGANIGLSILYFKRLYPKSRIVAFEADKSIFDILSRNVKNFALDDVQLINRAVWSSVTELNFTSDGADGGRLSVANDRSDHLVPTVRLKDYLDRKVDFLKLDIEGAETEVLHDCADQLANVGAVFVEYHSFDNQPQTLHVLTDVLTRAGFRLHIQAPMPAPQPFVKCHPDMGMDMQLNIFAFRPDDQV
jgi:FkbM family methyltransferase